MGQTHLLILPCNPAKNIDFYISFEIKAAVMMPNLKMDCSDFIGVQYFPPGRLIPFCIISDCQGNITDSSICKFHCSPSLQAVTHK